MAVQGLDAAFAAIIKDCQAVAVEAVKNAAKKAQTDILKEADTYLQKYYGNYPNPKRYRRTHRLKRAILPYWSDKSGRDRITIEVGVQYKSSALKGAYKSNSRFHQSGDVWRSITSTNDYSLNIPSPDKIQKFGADNGIPEPDWILNNFLEGVHPWAQTDGESTNSLMEEFFDKELPNRIEQYIQEGLFGAIVGRL